MRECVCVCVRVCTSNGVPVFTQTIQIVPLPLVASL